MSTRSHRSFVGPRAAVLSVAAIALLAAACSNASTASPSAGAASLPAQSAAASTPVAATSSASTPSATLASLSASASPGASPSGLLAQCSTVATGLLNPRGLTVASDGTIYVAEAGTGGTEPDFPSSPVASPGATLPASSIDALASPVASAASESAGASGSPEPVASHGETGQVTKITADGQQSVLVSGLTSYNFGPEVVGPAGVVVGTDGTMYVSIGGPGPGTALFQPAGNADSVVSVDSAGTVTQLANIGEYERTNNPDPNAVDSNLGGIALGTDGLLYVADSGGNDLYSVDPTTNELKLVTVFEGLPSVDNAPNPARGGLPEVDPVPTSVSADANGGVYVGFLTGAALWGTPGSAKVVHVDADGTTDDAVTGLNMVTGVAVNEDVIYATELSTSFLSDPPAAGAIASAMSGASAETVFSDVALPYGIAVAPDGKSLYIVINATGQPGAAPNGQVINCPLPETPSAPPSASPAASATPQASAPVESAPVESAPVESAPVESAPVVSPEPSTETSTAPASLPAESAPSSPPAS